MDRDEATPDPCPECHADNPWIYENDEYNCRHCGHVRMGSLGAKFRNEEEYVQPLTEIYHKNPVYRDITDRPLSTHSQKAESELYRHVVGCVRHTLNLPEVVAQRAWNILGIVRKKHSKIKIMQSVKNLAMSVALFAARESGHQVSHLTIAALIGKDVNYVANDVRIICKTMGKPYADFRGVNEYAKKVIRIVDDIAQMFIDETGLNQDVLEDKYFRNTQGFCASYKPHIHTVYEFSQKVERLGEVTGVWQKRTPDQLTIASVFIGLELASRLYQHHTRLFTDELGKHIALHPTSWLPRTREIQRVAMDLAFYLPQIGKARIVPELVQPWRGRFARPLPIGQVFILLLPDVLENMDALWEKRERDLERGKEADSRRDVEARLKDALSAFLPPIPEVQEASTAASDNASPDGQSVQPCQARSAEDSQTSSPSRLSTSLAVDPGACEEQQSTTRSRSVPRNMNRSSPPTANVDSCHSKRSTSLPFATALPLVASSVSAVTSAVESCESQSPSSAGTPLGKSRKRKRSEMQEAGMPRLDMRKRENRRVDPAEERQKQLDIRERFEHRLTETHSREVMRQHLQREAGIGVKNADSLKSGRRVYGRRRFGLFDTGSFQRLPAVVRFLQEWQTREMESQVNPDTEQDIRGRDHGWQLRHELRQGVDPLRIPPCRFPTSLAMAKAMLANADIDAPNIGSDDDMYFDEGELDSYLGDGQYQKARMELWKAQGLDNYVKTETIYSRRAVEIATKQDSRVARLMGADSKPKEKFNSARLAAVMESFRDDSDSLLEIDPILRKEFGRSVVQAAMQAEGSWEGGDKDDFSDDNDFYKNDDKSDGEMSDKEDELKDDDAYAPMSQGDDDAFEVVGDLDDYVGSKWN